MKNIDIEKLARQNIYSVPENFFENMQENVLKSVSEQSQIQPKKGAIIPLFWKYAAAAAVILGGLGIFMVNDQTETNQTILAHNVTKNPAEKSRKEVLPVAQYVKPSVATANGDNEDTHVIAPKSIERKAVVQDAPMKMTASTAVKKSNKSATNFDEKANALVASYSAAEIAKLSKEAEHDVYLDVFY